MHGGGVSCFRRVRRWLTAARLEQTWDYGTARPGHFDVIGMRAIVLQSILWILVIV